MSVASVGDQPINVPDDARLLLRRRFNQASLGTVRTELARCGAAAGLVDPELFNFVLAVNEITTNAVRYAGGQGLLRLWRDFPRLWCQIEDKGPGIPRRHLDQARGPRPGLTGGHGLWLARRICARMEIDTDQRTGTRVLMTYPLPLVDR